MKNATALLNMLENAGYEAYLVGGCVRDRLMGITPHDFDICTSALPTEILRVFSEFPVIPTGIKHGTVTVVKDGIAYEITTFRSDGTYSDGRHPDSVSFARTLREDVSRRDFTINAMALDKNGRLYDFFKGADDLEKRLIRCVGNPHERFSEDALRLLRAVRFAAKTGFCIEKETSDAVFDSAELIKKISAERIRTELFGLLQGNFAELLLCYSELFTFIIPEIAEMQQCSQNNVHHIYNVWEHSVRAAQAAPPDSVLRLALLLHDSAKPKVKTTDGNGQDHFYSHAALSSDTARKTCRRLKLSNADRERVVSLVKYHDYPLEANRKLLKRRLVKFGEPFLRELILVKRADNAAMSPEFDRSSLYDEISAVLDDIVAHDSCFSVDRLAVNGHDLVSLGMSGRQIGDTLNRLLTLVVDGKCENDRAALLKMIDKEDR